MTTTPTTPRKPVRNLGTMRTDPPQTASARAGADAALAAFALASPHLSGEPMRWSTGDAPAEYRDALQEVTEAVQFVKVNRDWSNEGKWRRVSSDSWSANCASARPKRLARSSSSCYQRTTRTATCCRPSARS